MPTFAVGIAGRPVPKPTGRGQGVAGGEADSDVCDAFLGKKGGHTVSHRQRVGAIQPPAQSRDGEIDGRHRKIPLSME